MTREDWLQSFADEARPEFARVGAPLPDEVRISVGFPAGGLRSKSIGECWSRAASNDEHYEIFIRPSLLDDAKRVADVLTHELVHAAVGIEAKHGPKFRKIAKALGLGGKMTATVAGEGWFLWANPVLGRIGPMPGAAMNEIRSTYKKQSTRMLKLACNHCGFTCRTTKKHLEAAGDGLICPIPACNGDLLREGEDDEGGEE